jgi:cellulose synthase/poly-beta-1,6-N-acetylglucosamine synthase-like glycosyltransferase
LIGDIRNFGLSFAHSEFVAFIDDDTLVTKEWFTECMKILQQPEVIGVTLNFTTAMICKTEQFKAVGGFPPLDSHVCFKKGIVKIDKPFGVIHYSSDIELFKHSLRWLTHGFNPENKFGFNYGVLPSVKQIFVNLQRKKPLMLTSYCLWFIKACYIKSLKRLV